MKTAKMQTPLDFDFNIGNLVQSPCRNCPNRSRLPGCRKKCKLLGRVQDTLANQVGTVHAMDRDDTYRVYLP